MSLLNQLEDGQNLTMELWAPHFDIPEHTSGRVTEGERAVNGLGMPQLIPQEGNTGYICQYIKDNTLFFRVDYFKPKLD